MIKVSNLSKKFRGTVAVDDLSFSVETGKVTGFLGPNGAGKSTTMRLMLGLDKGTGTATYDGKLLHEYEIPSKVVGILLEAKAYHTTRSARNHLKILATEGCVPIKRVDEVLDIVGLSDVAKKAPGKFSLGMSQRLGIAAAILANPKYLILDEPANGLDPEGIVWMREFLKSYADAGNAVFVSSHLLSEMAQMADNVVVIGKGKIIANTSISKLISGNAKSSVYVRSSNLTKLQKLLEAKSFDALSKDSGLEVSGADTDQVGKIAFDGGITVLELSPKHASLEDVFLELTEGTEQFKAQEVKDKK
ncbi:MAG TPA: ATP-binding cassette domain-containing protein [Candidatus Saccharimonadales bacterium]|nr:ATP-binding cassette domain-containing protein [Candidatus Saccharimonadales bacterium]